MWHRTCFTAGMRCAAKWAVVVLFLGLVQCAHSPEIRCGNNLDCRRQSDELRYCVESTCVECMSDRECEATEDCIEGECVAR
jgi:hypothetical protein